MPTRPSSASGGSEPEPKPAAAEEAEFAPGPDKTDDEMLAHGYAPLYRPNDPRSREEREAEGKIPGPPPQNGG